MNETKQNSQNKKTNETPNLCTQRAQSPLRKKQTNHSNFAGSAFEDYFMTRKVHTIHYWESECMAGRMTLAISNRNTTKSDLNKTATCYLTKQEVQRCHSGTCEFGGSSRREVPFLPPFCHSRCWHCLPDDLKMQRVPPSECPSHASILQASTHLQLSSLVPSPRP